MDNGFIGYNEGFVKDQRLLLQEIVDGLGLYNQAPDPMVAILSELVVRDETRVSQAPIGFDPEVEGARPELKRTLFRVLRFPLGTYNASTGFTKTGLEDALPSDVRASANAAMAGDAERVNGLMGHAIFVPRTPGSVAAPYEASFYNGETDVPAHGENVFTGAHTHYRGLGTTTLSADHITEAVEDIVEHGYGGPFVALFNVGQMAAVQEIQDKTSGIATAARAAAIDGGVLAGTRIRGVDVAFGNWVPAGYFAVISTQVPALGRREHINEAARGLQIYQANERTTEPLIDTEWRRRIGFRVRHLGAGAVRQLVGSATYTPPAMRFRP